jgi:hypothetical protein
VNVANTEAVVWIQLFWAETLCYFEWALKFFKHRVISIFKGQFICLTLENEDTEIVGNVGNYTPKTRRHILEHRMPQNCRCEVLKSP